MTRLHKTLTTKEVRNPRRIGFLMEEQHAVMPIGCIIDRLTSFRVGKALVSGNIPITPIEGHLKGKTCILPADTYILMDVGFA